MDIKLIHQAIDDVKVNLAFTSCNYTVTHKTLMCQAFDNLLRKDSKALHDYLALGTRNAKIQARIFQEYINLLETSLPFEFIKGNKKYVVKSLNDDNLKIFTDTQCFEQFVNNQFKIKNNTQQIYIGGRKASYVKPYYIGKLLDVVSLDGRLSFLSQVENYTFSYIKINGLKPGTKVKVIHLGIPPHYQMGPMVYLNRIKNEIKKRIKND